MKRLQFSIEIKAEPSKIWTALWSDNGYRDWAGIFFEGSYVIAKNWQEGHTVYFLSPDQSGIYSRIEKHIPNNIIRFTHIGNVVAGKEQEVDEESKKWSGATETYSVIKGINEATLRVDIDVMDEHVAFMTTTFPKALEKLKSNCT